MAKVPFESLHVDRLPSYRRTQGDIVGLSKSIATEGLQVPLLVRPVRSRVGGKDTTTYDVVDGRHRFEAIQAIRESDPKAFAEVEVKLYEGNETDALVMSFIANDQRHEHGPLDEADYLRMMVGRGHKLGEVAKRCGITASRASRVLAVRNKAPESMLRAIDEGKFPFSTAEQWISDGWTEARLESALKRYLETLEAAKGDKGAKKKASKEAGAFKVLGYKPLALMLDVLAPKVHESEYHKGMSDGIAVAIQKKDVPKDLQKEIEAAKARVRGMRPKKGASAE